MNSGLTAITIATSGVVNLIGLDINGQNSAGGNGITINAAAAVTIRNCKIFGFGAFGIQFQPNASGGTLVVDNVLLANNDHGIHQVSTVGSINMTVRNSTITNNAVGIFVNVTSGKHAGATIEQSILGFNNSDGLLTEGAGAVAIIGGSTVVNNGNGVSQSSGGTVYSAKNNQIYGNGTDGTPLTAYPGYSGGGA